MLIPGPACPAFGNRYLLALCSFKSFRSIKLSACITTRSSDTCTCGSEQWAVVDVYVPHDGADAGVSRAGNLAVGCDSSMQ